MILFDNIMSFYYDKKASNWEVNMEVRFGHYFEPNLNEGIGLSSSNLLPLDENKTIDENDSDQKLSDLRQFPLDGMSDITLQEIGEGIKFNKSLKERKNLRWLNDENIECLSQLCPLLEEVDLAGNFKITAKAIEFLAKNCEHLNSLNCSTARIKGDAFRPLIEHRVMLKELIATYAQADEKSLIDYLKVDHSLEFLDFPMNSSGNVLKAITSSKLTTIKVSLHSSLSPNELLKFINCQPSLYKAFINLTTLKLESNHVGILEEACLKLREVTLIVLKSQIQDQEANWDASFARIRSAGVNLTVL